MLIPHFALAIAYWHIELPSATQAAICGRSRASQEVFVEILRQLGDRAGRPDYAAAVADKL